MSIYSGFATRSQQQTYDQLIFNLVQVLSRKILKTYNHEQTDQLKFTLIIKEIFMKLSLMEKQKYLEPNISTALYDIMEHYLQHQKHQNKDAFQLQEKKPKFWVKKQNHSEQYFTDDTQRHQETKLQSRNTISNLQSHSKTPILNPERSEKQRTRERPEQYAIPLNNKFNRQKNSTLKEKQKAKKHQSLRRFQQDQLHNTTYRKKMPLKLLACPHCQEQRFSSKQKKPIFSRNQRSQSLKKQQQRHSRIVIPKLVKEYIESTSQNYMKQFRKRKVKYGPEFY